MEASTEVSRLITEVGEHQKEIRDLKFKLDASQSQLSVLGEECDKKSDEVVKLKKEMSAKPDIDVQGLADLRGELAAAQAQIQELTRMLVQANDVKVHLLQKTTADTSKVSDALLTVSAEKAALSSELYKLKCDLEAQRLKLADAATTQERLEKEKDVLQSNLDMVQGLIDDIGNKRNTPSSFFQTAKTYDVDKLVLANNALKFKLWENEDSYKKEVEWLRQELNKANEKLTCSDNEKARLEELSKPIHAELGAARAARDTALEKLEAASAEIHNLRKAKETSEMRIETILTQLQMRDEDVNDLRVQLESMQELLENEKSKQHTDAFVIVEDDDEGASDISMVDSLQVS
jgi:chromosome segregation ATPase